MNLPQLNFFHHCELNQHCAANLLFTR